MHKGNKIHYVVSELGHHLPFSIFGVTVGFILVGLLNFFAVLSSSQSLIPDASQELFHVFHPAHILFSAVTTTAMFWKHEKNLAKAVMVGFLGSILICGLSDMLLPFIGGIMLGADMHLHVCLINNPVMIITFAVIGVIAGLLVRGNVTQSIKYSHSAHVFISSSASILYMLSFGLRDWVHGIGNLFIVIVVSVMLPCCLSDIVFPLTCAHRGCGCKT
jgi:hypothetical protein